LRKFLPLKPARARRLLAWMLYEVIPAAAAAGVIVPFP